MGLVWVWVRTRVSVSIGGRVRVSFFGVHLGLGLGVRLGLGRSFRVRFWLGTRKAGPLPQYGSFISSENISKIFLDNISMLWNWTKVWKLDFPTFFYNIFKTFPYSGRGPIFSKWARYPT